MAYSYGKPGQRAWMKALLWFTTGSVAVGAPMWALGHLPQMAAMQGWLTPNGAIKPAVTLLAIMGITVIGWTGFQFLYKGRRQETISRTQANVADILLRLPDEYVVIHQVSLKEGTIDHIVVGPTGCYVLLVHAVSLVHDPDRPEPTPWTSMQAAIEQQISHRAAFLAKVLQAILATQGMSGRHIYPLVVLTVPVEWTTRYHQETALVPIWDLLAHITKPNHQLSRSIQHHILNAIPGQEGHHLPHGKPGHKMTGKGRDA